jgi:hypothetical protein
MLDTEQQELIRRFGVFEFNRATGELRKRGVRLKLQQQPRQILEMLLERAGEVVTREDLQRALWPSDVYIDFDTAINSSVRKLRETLNDGRWPPLYRDAAAPRIPFYRAGDRRVTSVSRNTNRAACPRHPKTR